MTGRVSKLYSPEGGPYARDGRRADPAAPLTSVISTVLLVACFTIGSARAADDAPAPESGPATIARQPGTALLYFFSPDWRPPDLGKLTAAVEGALAAGGVPVSFQGFTKYEDFERQLREAPPEFLIAPAWIADSPALVPGLSLTVVARPLHHGKTTYRKALMTRPGIDSIDDLARGSIAATVHSMSNGSSEAVLGAFHLTADSARIVPVPKDVDALLALSFGQVDAALVTSQEYEQLSRTSPAEAERLRVLAFSPEVGLPPVFASAQADADAIRRLRDLLLRLRDIPNGSSVLAMLGFDGFDGPGPAVAADSSAHRRSGQDAAGHADQVAGAQTPSAGHVSSTSAHLHASRAPGHGHASVHHTKRAQGN